MAQYVLTGVILLACTYTDLRQRRIYRSVIGAHLILAFLIHLMMKDFRPFAVAMGLLPGLSGLLLAAITNQAMGYGDAFLILSCGFSLGLERELPLLLIAFLGAGIWALILLVFQRGKKNSEIPFAPFLAAGAFIQGLSVLL